MQHSLQNIIAVADSCWVEAAFICGAAHCADIVSGRIRASQLQVCFVYFAVFFSYRRSELVLKAHWMHRLMFSSLQIKLGLASFLNAHTPTYILIVWDKSWYIWNCQCFFLSYTLIGALAQDIPDGFCDAPFHKDSHGLGVHLYQMHFHCINIGPYLPSKKTVSNWNKMYSNPL